MVFANSHLNIFAGEIIASTRLNEIVYEQP